MHTARKETWTLHTINRRKKRQGNKIEIKREEKKRTLTKTKRGDIVKFRNTILESFNNFVVT